MNFNTITYLETDETPLFFTSDLHFFHKRIIEFTGRPTTYENLNDWVIKQCNSKITLSSSIVFHLGDMFFSCTNEEAVEVLSKLNGNWHFILGNHDNPAKLETVINTVNKSKGSSHKILGWYQKVLIKSQQKDPSKKVPKKSVVLCHFPIEDWDSMSYGTYMIHGHTHGNTSQHDGFGIRSMPNRFDVGLDNSHTFTPFSFDEVRDCIYKINEKIGKD